MKYIVTEYKETGRGCIELCLNETIRLFLYTKEVRELSLEEGAQLSEEVYWHILYEIIAKRATKRAMHLLEQQDRTEQQLRTKLQQNHYPPEAVEEAVSYVKSYHYLDDERYARTFIHMNQEKRSRLRLKQDLMKRGIAKDMIEAQMEQEFSADERKKIQNLLVKKNFAADTADRNEVRKMYQFLLRRGFQSSDIKAVLCQSDFDSWE